MISVAEDITAPAVDSASDAQESITIADEITAVEDAIARVHHIRRTSLDDDS